MAIPKGPRSLVSGLAQKVHRRFQARVIQILNRARIQSERQRILDRFTIQKCNIFDFQFPESPPKKTGIIRNDNSIPIDPSLFLII
jgi:hypothetical protein